jgi:DNA-binding transcriptional MerR regulator
VNVISAPDVPWVTPPKLYRIGEVVRYSGFSRQTIHNYTTMGLISERERTEGGHRMYGEDVFPVLAMIKSLKGDKTLAEIRDILDARRTMVGDADQAEPPAPGSMS